MNYLFIDTETTGLPVNYQGLITDSSNWPRIVQLGYIITNQHGNEIHIEEQVIKPVGWKVKATEVHGITQEQAEQKGIPLARALTKLTSWAHACDAIICHNIDFDLPILQAEYYREQMLHPLKGKLFFCTQKQTTDIVKVRKRQSGFRQSGYKWPSLRELANYCNVKYGDNAHTALADARVTAKCFHHLDDILENAFKEPYNYRFVNETVGHEPSGKPGCKSFII